MSKEKDISAALSKYVDDYVSKPAFRAQLEANDASDETRPKCLNCEDKPGQIRQALCCSDCWFNKVQPDKRYKTAVAKFQKYFSDIAEQTEKVVQMKLQAEADEREGKWDSDANERRTRGDLASKKRKVVEPKTCTALTMDVGGCRRPVFNRPRKLEWLTQNEVFMPTEKNPPLIFMCRTPNLISTSIQQLSALVEQLPGIPRDGSARGDMLVDLIDPNAFPLDKQRVNTPTLFRHSDGERKTADKGLRTDNSMSGSPRPPLRYQWLPSDVSVRKGCAYFTSPICGVDDDSPLIPYFELALTRMLPMFETALGISKALPKKESRWDKPLYSSFLPSSDLQFIVKCQTYNLPAQASYSGEFHREGPPSEHIVAVGLLYLHVDPRLQGGELDFKVVVDRGCGGTAVDELKTDAQTGLAVVFRNDRVYHRMGTLTHPTADGFCPPAARTVLGFFLVDPSVRQPSTFGHLRQSNSGRELNSLLSAALGKVGPLVILVRSYLGMLITEQELAVRTQMIQERRFPDASPESFMRGGHMD